MFDADAEAGALASHLSSLFVELVPDDRTTGDRAFFFDIDVSPVWVYTMLQIVDRAASESGSERNRPDVKSPAWGWHMRLAARRQLAEIALCVFAKLFQTASEIEHLFCLEVMAAIVEPTR